MLENLIQKRFITNKIKTKTSNIGKTKLLELRHSKLPGLCTFNNIVILLGQKLR